MGLWRRARKRGQVLVMVTLALMMMCGMIGLVIDLGWSYYMRKSAQAAADTAALAAVRRAMAIGASMASYDCTGGVVTCASTPIDCPGAPGNLASACLYAQNHGFSTNSRQRVTVQASDQATAPTVVEACGQGGANVHHPPTAGCVDTFYWVTVRISEQIPQLFSAILGNTLGVVSARATAAVARVELIGSLILINRENDPWTPSGNPQPNGYNLYVGGTPDVIVPGGILLASNAAGPSNADPWAGFISGSGTVTAPWTHIRSGGNYAISGGGSWITTPDNMGDGSWFEDPYQNVYGPRQGGQPPLNSNLAAVPAKPVLNGDLSGYCGGTCEPGNYFAVAQVNGQTVATGNQLTITSDVIFNGGAFGDFHFFGGLNVGQARVTFGPGRYVFAGVSDPVRTPLLNNDNKSTLVSSSSGGDAGRLFILTDSPAANSGYPGLVDHVQTIDSYLTGIGGVRRWAGPGNTLYFAKSSIKAGNNLSSRVELWGLNDTSPTLPAELEPFALSPVYGRGAGLMIWQDQRNSYVKYTSDGQVDTSCGDLSDPCYNSSPAPPGDSPQLEIWATPYAKYEGVVYQPRGAWTVLQAAGDYQGAMRIVTGALKTQGSGVLNMAGEAPPIINYMTALVE